MKRSTLRERLVFMIAAVVIHAALDPAAVGAAEVQRPNVLMIVVDDLRPELGCYGVKEAHTPAIDRLAAKGMCFTRAYCQYPVCNASRTSFLTGLRPETTQVFSNDLFFREKLPQAVTLPQVFRNNGYHTVSLDKIFHAGKLHGQDDLKNSWSEVRNFAATPKLGGEGRSLPFPGGNKGWCRWMAAEGTDEDQPDGQAAAEAVRQLREPAKKPWLLAVGFHKPHDPFISPKKYFDLYPLDKIVLPKEPADRSPELKASLPNGLDFSKFTDDDRREFKRAYLAGVSFTDAQVGKLLDELDRQDLWQNTIVVFFGDHGYHLGEHGWWNKSTIYEESARVPLLVWDPGMRGAGQKCASLVELVDLYPTLCDLCHIDPPGGLQGASFAGLLDDPNLPGKDAAYTMVLRGGTIGRSVRTPRWRLTKWTGQQAGVELYDQDADPDDYHNLADKPQYAAMVKELEKLLDLSPAK